MDLSMADLLLPIWMISVFAAYWIGKFVGVEKAFDKMREMNKLT